MPDLDATLHVKMVRPKKKRRLLPRIIAAIKRELASPNVYGLQWGDPDIVRPLRFIRDRYVLAYVRPEDTAVEIGPGGMEFIKNNGTDFPGIPERSIDYLF